MNNVDEIMFHDMQLVNDYKHAQVLSMQFHTKISKMDKSQIGRFHHSRAAVHKADYQYKVKKVG